MPEDSVAHLLTFLALIRLLHSPPGQQLLALRLPAATAVLLKGLDMDRPALRRTCLPVRLLCAPLPFLPKPGAEPGVSARLRS